MKRGFIFLLAVGLFTTVFAQDRETRNLDSFNKLSVSEGIKVTLEKGTSEKAEIFVDNIDLGDVETDVSGNELRIYLDGNNHRNIDVEVTLTYHEIDEISISSAASVSGKDALTAGSIELDASSAGRGDLVLDAGDVEVDISSAASISLSGKAGDIEVNVSSAGELEAFELECREAEVDVSSAGKVEITVTDRLEAEASSGGKVRYQGNPDKVYVESSSGGSVKKD